MDRLDCLDDWVTFFELIYAGKGELLTNIAAKLYMDVVKLAGCGSIHGMRFSKDVKLFGTLAVHMFHAKFIRFMGGFKNIGQNGNEKPNLSLIHFVCPNMKILHNVK